MGSHSAALILLYAGRVAFVPGILKTVILKSVTLKRMIRDLERKDHCGPLNHLPPSS